MVDSEAIREARRALGRKLSAHRRAAGHTQETFAPLVRYGRSTIANVETGRQNVPREFWIRSDEILDCNGELIRSHDELEQLVREDHRHRASAHSVLTDVVDWLVLERSAKRRGVLDVARGAVLAAAVGSPAAAGIDGLVRALIAANRPPLPEQEPDLARLEAAVSLSKRNYQACRYREVLNALPRLLATTKSAVEVTDGDRARAANALTAETYRVAGSLLLKFDDAPLALLAADRSLEAARRSGDPLTVATSARVLTHAVMSSGHPYRAAQFAQAMITDFDRTVSQPSAEALAVYGALLLRAAIATARNEDREATVDLLDTASAAASRLAHDGNLRWTAFGPTNVILHRINISVTLGDAGKALDYARQVRLERIPVTERRAGLFIDVARAYAQWGKYERAYQALRAAEETAPEEVRARQSLWSLVTDLAQRAPSRLKPRIREMAERIGVAV